MSTDRDRHNLASIFTIGESQFQTEEQHLKSLIPRLKNSASMFGRTNRRRKFRRFIPAADAQGSEQLLIPISIYLVC
jgi:hypothetical protein